MSDNWKMPVPNSYTDADIEFVSGLAMEQIPDDISGMEAYLETVHAWSVWIIKPYTEAMVTYDKKAMAITIREREKHRGIPATQLEAICHGELADELREVRVLKLLSEQIQSKVEITRTFIKTERDRLAGSKGGA